MHPVTCRDNRSERGRRVGAVWLVDASNVVGARPDGWWRDRPAALARLADALDAWAPATDRVVCVLDGRATPGLPDGPRGRIEVVSAGRGGPDAADDAIVALVEQAPDPTAVTVVSSDRALRDRATARGARVVGAGTFRDALPGM